MHILPLSAKEVEKKLLNVPDTWEEVTDKTYNPESLHPQSGQAVAEALNSKSDCFVGIDVSLQNYQGFTLLDGGFVGITGDVKVGDIYINKDEKIMYQCTSVTEVNTNVHHYIWRIVSPIVDQNYSSSSENPQSGQAVAEALKNYVLQVDNKDLSTNDFTNSYKALLDDVFMVEYGVHNFTEIFAAALARKKIFCFKQNNADNISLYTLAYAHLDRIVFYGHSAQGKERLECDDSGNWRTVLVNCIVNGHLHTVLTEDNTQYYLDNVEYTYIVDENLPNGWSGTIIVNAQNVSVITFDGDLLEYSENGFTLQDLSTLKCFSMHVFKSGDALHWYLLGSLPKAEENTF